MGLGLVLISYVVVAFIMFFAGPILFWFATNKFGKFDNNTLKKHALFWGAWFLVNAIITFIQSGISGHLPELNDLLNASFLLTLTIHIGLCMAIFKVELVPALKASLAYAVLFVLSFIFVAFIAIQFSFHEIIMGSQK
tara:strand:+ start:1857 stop:2270 length:414 start_codon:yes stop_codon:yes gene_type:complete